MSNTDPGDINLIQRRTVPLFDVEVTPLDADEVAGIVLDHIAQSKTLVVGNLNLHGVYLFHTDEKFAEFCRRSNLVLIDGAPVAWAARQPMSKRIGSTDWIDALLPRASDLNILAIGGTPEASAAAERHMLEHYPAVKWIGIDGYSCQMPDENLRSTIAKSQLILVGMGMPLQEQWINRNSALLETKVVANVGGCFDYYAGVQPLAPRWLGSVGLEWLYRLARNPSRLAKRYLVEPFRLARLLCRMKISSEAGRAFKRR